MALNLIAVFMLLLLLLSSFVAKVQPFRITSLRPFARAGGNSDSTVAIIILGILIFITIVQCWWKCHKRDRKKRNKRSAEDTS